MFEQVRPCYATVAPHMVTMDSCLLFQVYHTCSQTQGQALRVLAAARSLDFVARAWSPLVEQVR
jgi:hypothetical protein